MMRNAIRLIMLCVAILCLACFGQAQAASGSKTFSENFTTTVYRDTAKTTADWAGALSLPRTGLSNQTSSSIVKDTAGNYVFTWTDLRNPTSGVYISKFSASGLKLWGDKKVADGAVSKVACDSANNIYVVFTPNATSYVYVYKFDVNGNYLTSFRADTDAIPSTQGNAIAVDGTNNVYVAYDNRISKFNSSGTRLWGPVQLNTGSYNPDVAVSGSYVYVSNHTLWGTGPFAMNICRIDPANGNSLWANPVKVADGNWLSIGVETTGNVVAAYSENTGYKVYYKKFSPAGALLVGPLLVDDQPYAYAFASDISVDSANNKYILYRSNPSYPTFLYYVRAQKISAADALVWGTTGKQVSLDFTRSAPLPVGAPAADGSVFVVWDQLDGIYDAAYYHYNARAIVMTPTGERLWPSAICVHSAPEYAASAIGQSLTIDTVAEYIKSATLTNSYPALLSGQTVVYSLSNNGGTNWYQVSPGIRFDFPVRGSDLRFQVALGTVSRSLDLRVGELNMTYDYADLTGDITPPTGTPTVPVDQGVYISVQELTFTWTKGTSADLETGIIQYQLQVAADPAFTNVLFFGDVGNVTSYTVSGAAQGGTYYARVRAKNGAGLYGAFSGTSNGIKVDITNPTGWSIVTDTGSTTTITDLTFSWNPALYVDPESGIANFELWVRPDTNFTGTDGLYYGLTGNVSSFTVHGAAVGSTYYAKVRAINGAGRYAVSSFFGPASDGITVLPPDTTPPTGVPSKPTDAGVYGTASLLFKWTVGTAADLQSGIAGYYLQVASDTAFTNLKYNAYVGNVTSFTVTGCVHNAKYYARVKARNANGLFTVYSPTSDGIQVDTTAPTGVPTVPLDAGVTTTATTLNFTWTKNTAADPESGIIGYHLQVATDTAFTNLKFNAYVGAVTTYSVKDCVVGSTYYARVRARNGALTYGVFSGASNGIKVVLAP